jgi:uncharacterized membrane protein YccF (DUF307 family)
MFLFYFLFGLVLCLTLVGIVFGIQVWKLAFYVIWPFGRKVVGTDSVQKRGIDSDVAVQLPTAPAGA